MATDASAHGSRSTRRLPDAAGALPFFAYVGTFLIVPTIIVAVGAFRSADGAFTFDNVAQLTNSNVLDAFKTSLLVSALSALVGALVGGPGAWAIASRGGKTTFMRRLVTSLCSVLAQFGGVMLAFAFIATIGINGMVTLLLSSKVGYQLDPTWIATLPGLVLVYAYFQIPLMIIVFAPAVDAIKPQWREATETLGGSGLTYWTRVALPLLWPRFLGAFLLLFANAFSAYATAAALFAQRSILVPLMIQGAMRNEQDTGLNGLAQVLALAMVVVVAIVMAAYAALQRRTAAWEE